MPFALFLALKYLKPKRSFTSVVTVISVLGVVLGVAIILIVRAVMTGFGDMWREKILSFKPHVTIQAQQDAILHEDKLCRKIEAVPGVLAASPSVETRVLAEFQHRILAPIVIGLDPARAEKMMPAMRMAAGKFDIDGDGVVIGVDMAINLGVRVGDHILIHSPMSVIKPDELHLPEELEVRGIFDAGQRQFDGDLVLVSIGVGRDLLGMSQGASSIHVKTANPEDARQFVPTLEAIRAAIGPNYVLQTWQEVDREIFNALAVEKNMMVILLMFTTIVAMFCVTNTLIVITVQKTDEIGLLKALGFSSRQVLWTFVLHGWIQCFVGTVLGIGLAMLVLHNLQHLVDFLAHFGLHVFPKSVYGLAQIPWRLIPSEVAQVGILVIVFCTLASIIPAARAARLDPVEALRKE